MPIAIEGSSGSINKLVSEFSPSYHRDYWRVRKLGRAYLAYENPIVAANTLAPALSAVLRNWGAGLRKAPQVKSIPIMRNALESNLAHQSPVTIQNSLRSGLTIADGTRAIAAAGGKRTNDRYL